MLKFGDVVRVGTIYYIYLATKGDGVTYYLAKILSDEDTIKQLLHKKDKYKEFPHNPQKQNVITLLTCFIVLTTDDFRNYLASLAPSAAGHNINISPNCQLIGKLNEEDVANLSKEILENKPVLPPQLIREVEEIFGNE